MVIFCPAMENMFTIVHV